MAWDQSYHCGGLFKSEFNRTNTTACATSSLLSNSGSVLDLRFGTRDGFLKSWFEGWYFLYELTIFMVLSKPKSTWNHIVAPVKSHFFKTAFNWRKWLDCSDPQHRCFQSCKSASVDSGCDITRDVKSGTVRFLNHSWWKVDIELNDASTLRLFQQASRIWQFPSILSL